MVLISSIYLTCVSVISRLFERLAEIADNQQRRDTKRSIIVDTDTKQ